MSLQVERIRVLTDELKLPGIESNFTALAHYRLMGPAKFPKPKKESHKKSVALRLYGSSKMT